MTMLRLLAPTLAALALSTTVSAAGPCTQQIAQVRAQIDAKLRANAAAGPTAPENPAALRSRQPTPQSITLPFLFILRLKAPDRRYRSLRRQMNPSLMTTFMESIV
jgi:hypothetical protein